jgi:hypothetical protein
MAGYPDSFSIRHSAGYPAIFIWYRPGYPAIESGIRLDTVYKKAGIIRPARYPVHPF